jgi:hypothetical protein
MNQGNAFFGLLWLVGAYLVFGWPAALLGLLLVASWIEPMIYRGMGRVLRNSAGRRGFAYQSPVEQALRRGSQGFALMVLAGAAACALVWFFGWPGFRR